jgi:hypothetical protein
MSTQWKKHVERMDPDRLLKQVLSYAPRIAEVWADSKSAGKRSNVV